MQKGNQPRLLITDLNHNVRNYLKRELEKEGYAVTSAEDGVSLIDHLKEKERYDILVFDPEVLQSSEDVVRGIMMQHDSGVKIIVHAYDEHLQDFSGYKGVETVAKNASSIFRLRQIIRRLVSTPPAF